jgi:hypothetical protein
MYADSQSFRERLGGIRFEEAIWQRHQRIVMLTFDDYRIRHNYFEK